MISVIIPVYNTGAEAEKLVKRLLTDRWQDFEIILVDDGSSDDSPSRLKSLARTDKRIRVIIQQNAGASAARNVGINISRGEYLCFIDSDDMVAKDYLYAMGTAIQKHSNASFAVCGRRYHRVLEGTDRIMNVGPLRPRRNREKLGDYIVYMLITGERIYSSIDKIYRSDVIKAHDLKFEVGRDFAEDSKFVLDYLEYSTGDIICVNKPLYIYYYGTETSTVRKSALVWANWKRQHDDTKTWAKRVNGGKLSLKSYVLLNLLRLRWKISYIKARLRA